MLARLQYQFLMKKIETLEHGNHGGERHLEEKKYEPQSDAPQTTTEVIERVKYLEKRIEKIVENNYSQTHKQTQEIKHLKGLVEMHEEDNKYLKNQIEEHK